MNQRGFTVPLNFLIGIVIALIIFIPTSMAIAKVLGLSREAQQSYVKLVKEVQDFDDPVTQVLHLDLETAVVYFEKGAAAIEVYVQGSGNLDCFDCQSHQAEVTITKPPQCGGEAACLCLFRKIDASRTFVPDDAREQCLSSGCYTIRIQEEATITGTVVQCTQELPQELMLLDCGLGKPTTVAPVVEYHCRNGFIIERGVFKDAGLSGFLLNPQQILLNLWQEPHTIKTIILEAQQ